MLVEAICLAIGLYLLIVITIAGAGMKGPVSSRITKLLGRTWMRIVSGILGLLFIAAAVTSYLGVLNLA